MAAQFVPVVRNGYTFEEDPNCRYSYFHHKPEGKIPCLALGNCVADDTGEVVGLTFQKATDASIRPVIETDMFTDIEWNNAPTKLINGGRRQEINLLDARYAPPVIPPSWLDFARTMQYTRNFILDQVQPPQETLQKCFSKLDVSPGTLIVGDLVQHIAANGGVWTNDEVFREWAEVVLDGCYGSPNTELTGVFKSLYPALFPSDSFKLVNPPGSTTRNATIFKGVPHCLNYGYHENKLKRKKKRGAYVYPDTDDEDDPEPVNSSSTDDEEYEDQKDEANGPRRPQEIINRGRVEKRVILSKQMDKRARSRSRSPLSSDDEVDMRRNVVNIQNQQRPNQVHDLDFILANPDHFYLKSDRYFKFFEPHKPDLVCRQNLEHNKVTVKFVCEIASWNKEGRKEKGVSVKRLVSESTKQCVQSALASLAHNQKFILGIIVVPDGMKVFQVKKKQRHYKIKETPLALWSEDQKLFALLEMIRKAIIF